MEMGDEYESQVTDAVATVPPELERELFARHAEIESMQDLLGTENQRGTTIPALFNTFYKFTQNPSSVSIETFKRMVDTDDTIGSGVDFLTTCLAARLGRYTHPSSEITEYVNKGIEGMKGGWVPTLKQVLSATWAGYAVGEKVWKNTTEGFLPEKLMVFPPSTVMFETDRQGEVTSDGILQYQRNYNPLLLGQGISYFAGISTFGFTQPFKPDMWAKYGDLAFPLRAANYYNYMAIRIPKLKCLHFAFDAQGVFGSPYGRSLLRRIYNQFISKHAFLQMLAVALDRKGTPLTIVYADPNQSIEDASRTDFSLNNKGKTGNKIRADVAARQAFQNIHNDTTIILPGKKGQWYDVDFVEQQSNADVFIQAINMCDRGILRGLLVPSLIFGNGDGTGSYSLGQEHAKSFDKICDSINSGLEAVLVDQLVKEIICYNFPKSAYEKDGFGSFGKRELGGEERDKELQAVQTAVNMGAVDMNDLNDLNKARELAGFEPRSEPIIREQPAFGTEDINGQDQNDDTGNELRAAIRAARKEAPDAKSVEIAERLYKRFTAADKAAA